MKLRGFQFIYKSATIQFQFIYKNTILQNDTQLDGFLYIYKNANNESAKNEIGWVSIYSQKCHSMYLQKCHLDQLK